MTSDRAHANAHLVFDVGGTQLRAGIYDGVSETLAEVVRADAPSFLRHPTASWPDLRARLFADLSELRGRLDPRGEVRSAAVAFAGPIDPQHRVVASPTLWGASGKYPYPLQDDLKDAWPGVDVCVLNDVTAAGYRYLRSPVDEFCVVTVSTGIGNKVFAGGRPLVGPTGEGGEIGHLQVDASPNAPVCDCGGRGHLGAIASGRAAAARARLRAERDDAGFRRSGLSQQGLSAHGLTAEALAAAYRAGDVWTTDVIRPAVDALGAALAAIHLAIGVDRFVLIGGFALGLGEKFLLEVRAALNARCWRGGADAAVVMAGEADGQCALIGGGRAMHLGLLSPGSRPQWRAT